MQVRPIGTEFEVCCPPESGSTKTAFTVFVYRVTGYATVAAHPEAKSHQAESIEVVDSRDYEPVCYKVWGRQWMPVPPKECAHLMDEMWQALAASI